MKRIVIICIVALAAIGTVSAQGFGGRAAPAASAQAELVTIEGKLSLVQGRPAVVIKDTTYFIRLPQHLYGFIDGLKEGATVKLDGYAAEVPFAPSSLFFSVEKLTIGGKSYDLSQLARQAPSAMGGRGGRGGPSKDYGRRR